jgi:hypothetical protein
MNGAVAIRNDLFVPGPAVRPEYCKLCRDLGVLSRSFGIILPAQLEGDAAALTFSIECADRLLDAIPHADGRARLSAAILSFWQNDDSSNDELTPELVTWLGRLREIAERHAVTDAYHEIIRELLRNSECMRMMQSHREFVACVILEGRLMVELLLLVLAKSSTSRFDSFMRQLSEPANLLDKLRDARRDFARGEIAAKPTLTFRARLMWEMAWRAARLACLAALNWRVLRWAVESLFNELICFPFSKAHSR